MLLTDISFANLNYYYRSSKCISKRAKIVCSNYFDLYGRLFKLFQVGVPLTVFSYYDFSLIYV